MPDLRGGVRVAVVGLLVAASAWLHAGEPGAYAHLATDKPIYRAGETVHVRATLLRALDHRPHLAPVAAMVEVVGPRGDLIERRGATAEHGVLALAWTLPMEAAGGEWRVRVVETPGVVAAERTFAVEAVRAAPLTARLELARDSYAPGQDVAADLRVTRADGSAPAAATVTVVARVGGVEVARQPATLAADGTARVKVALPADVAGEAVLAAVVDEGGAQATVARAIPLAGDRLDLRFHPEGGDLVAGLPTRLYVEAFLPDGRPADFSGGIQDETSRVVAAIAAAHEGRARSPVFTPQAGARYVLWLDRPSRQGHALPQVRASGGAIAATADVYAQGRPVDVAVASTVAGPAVVTLAKRGLAVATARVDLAAGVPATVALTPPDWADGALTATLADAAGTPLAERLLFRRPAPLRIAISPASAVRAPGESVELTVTTTDAHGRPVAACVGLAVSDGRVRALVARRERAPRLPAMALLENDVAALADAGLYLDGDDARAPLACDLLLGTQGWRRFASVDGERFAAHHGAPGRRILGWPAISERFEVLTGREPAASLLPLRSAVGPAPQDREVTVAPADPSPGGAVDSPDDASAPRGREEAGADSEMGGQGAFMAIGAGASGMFGSRNGGGKRRALARFGGNRAGESAVDAALRFLKKHQSPDGGWSLTGYPDNCTEQPTCEPGPAWPDGDGDLAVTAQCALCFLGAGYDHRMPSKHRATVGKAIDRLLASIRPDGALAGGDWAHALGTQALCDAYAMSADPALKAPAQRAVDHLRQRQRDGRGVGWGGTFPDGRPGDAVIGMAAVMAIKSALAAGLRVGEGIDRARDALRRSVDAANADLGPGRPIRFPAAWEGAARTPSLPGVGLLMGVFLGWRVADPATDGLAAAALAEVDTLARLDDLVHLHAATIGLFQYGGESWTRWNGVVRDAVIAAQRRTADCFDGSWDPRVTTAGPDGGRLFATALACQSLQIYYRYLPVAHSRDGAVPGAQWPMRREFAHRAPRPPRTDRSAVADTLYWHAGLRTDPVNGSATVRFDCADNLAAFRIEADAVAADGALGQADAVLTVARALSVEPTLPGELTVGDRVEVPLVVNAAADAEVAIAAVGGAALVPLAVVAGRPASAVLPLTATVPGPMRLHLRATAGQRSDEVVRTIPVQPAGFPHVVDRGGRLVGEREEVATVVLPTALPGSVRATLRLYPGAGARLGQAMERLQQEPTGCFEQTSATLWPLALAQRVLRGRGDARPEVLARGDELLGRGCTRLLGFRAGDGGFTWHGRGHGDLRLTALALMQVADLAAVDVPGAAPVLPAASAWLLDRRHHWSKAGAWSGDARCQAAYVLWAVLSTAADEQRVALAEHLADELAAVERVALADGNAYLTVVAANALIAGRRGEPADRLLARLSVDADGHVRGATQSPFNSGGDSLHIEATALAVLAWQQRGGNEAAVALALHWLATRCQDGRFGSTQATVLALRAIAAQPVPRERKAPPDPGTGVIISVDGQVVTTGVDIDPSALAPVTVDLSAAFGSGPRTLRLRQRGHQVVPWSLSVACATEQGDSHAGCPLRLAAALSHQRIASGEPLDCTVSVRNVAAEAAYAPMAIVGLPAGCTPRADALRELVRSGRVAACEVRGRELVLYWDGLAAGAAVDLRIGLVAGIPGRYRGPASRAYCYYTDERMQWVGPLELIVTAR